MEDDDDDGDDKCISSIKGFNGITFCALNLIELDVWLCTRARACFNDVATFDKSATAASGELDDAVFNKKDFIIGFNANDDDNPCGCLFDSYIAHSSTL